MSRPIYEPSLPRADAVLGYGSRQLFRRPAPVSEGGGTTAALVNDLSFENIGDNLIPDDDWTLVVDGGGSRFWLEGWRRDADWNVFDGTSSDLNISRSDFALYVAYATTAFPSAADGIDIGIGVQFATSAAWHHANVMPVRNGVQRVTVVAPWWGDLDDGVRLWCYQNSGGDLDIADETTLHVRMFELNADGEYLDFS